MIFLGLITIVVGGILFYFAFVRHKPINPDAEMDFWEP